MTDKKLNINDAMLKFHAEFNGVDKTGFNPHFKSKHFTLEDIIHKTTPILHKLGLYVAHQIAGSELITSIFNAEGACLRSSMPMALNNNPQAMGSLITYYRRYNLCCLLNIAEKDDDAEAAMVQADLDEQKARQTPIVAKPPATKAQKEALVKFAESDEANIRQVKYIKANLNKFTMEDAEELLVKIKPEKENGK